MNNPMDELRELPDSVYSNFDHELDEKVADELRKGGCRAQHAGWNFCAWVYREGSKWHSYVMCYGSHRASFEDDDLRSLINTVNNEFGRQ
jgi:hypothetical protein